MSKTKSGKYQTTVRFESEQEYNKFLELCTHFKNYQNGTAKYCLSYVYKEVFTES